MCNDDVEQKPIILSGFTAIASSIYCYNILILNIATMAIYNINIYSRTKNFNDYIKENLVVLNKTSEY